MDRQHCAVSSNERLMKLSGGVCSAVPENLSENSSPRQRIFRHLQEREYRANKQLLSETIYLDLHKRSGA